MNKISMLIGACIVSTFAYGQSKTGAKPMNVVFIAIDDMNNWVGSWGGQAITPNIDQLASQGTQFLNAHCVVPACNPSRVALLTGQRPETTGQYVNEGNFRAIPGGSERVTLPQFLMGKGYEAVAAGKIFHNPVGTGATPNQMSDPVSWNYQFPVIVGTPPNKKMLDANGHAKWLNGASEHNGVAIIDYIRQHGVWGPISESKEECGDWKTATFCADFLQKTHDKPFFLACGIFRPHSPQFAPQEYFDMYPLDKIKMPELPVGDMDDIPSIAQTNWSTSFTLKLLENPEEYKRAVQAYLACSTFADDCIGEVLRAIEKSPYKDNTMIVLWSDHGWQLGHKNRWEKFSLWNQATNAPMIVKLPNQKPKKVVDPVSYLDIYPTVLEACGYEKTATLDGNSLMPLITKKKTKWNYPAITTYQEGNTSVSMKNWRYIHYEDGTEELYNLTTDPNEYTNLATDPKHRALMDEYKKHLPVVKIPQPLKKKGG